MTTCSLASAQIDEPLAGTATECPLWLVVEQSGSYSGREALLTSGFPAHVGERLQERVAQAGGKVLLVRRPGRHPRQVHDHRRVWVCRAHFASTRAWATTIEDPEQLLDWDPGEPERLPGPVAPLSRSTLLVCSHARRDRCCASAARTLLNGPLPADSDIWEASHLGGHRFAPVVLDIGTGYQYGRVSGSDLVAIGDSWATDEVPVTVARGHTGLPAVLQAVDLFLRSRGLRATLDPAMDTAGPITVHTSTGDVLVISAEAVPLGDRPESCGGTAGAAHRWNLSVNDGV